jgi:hypothetical protein
MRSMRWWFVFRNREPLHKVCSFTHRGRPWSQRTGVMQGEILISGLWKLSVTEWLVPVPGGVRTLSAQLTAQAITMIVVTVNMKKLLD